jgi:hypothetical protein
MMNITKVIQYINLTNNKKQIKNILIEQNSLRFPFIYVYIYICM